ncbi:MAG: hypothetical protein JXA54_15865 [Candidatus Heimdallarchaeota archaeon]|nr:hypothetical protein [Candidatus Heimdallarchaeota archaeon]
MFTSRPSIIMDAALHYRSILKGEKNFQPLHELDSGTDGIPLNINLLPTYNQLESITSSYVFCQMSGVELGFHLIMFLVLILQLLFLVYIPPTQFTFINVAVENFFTYGIIGLLTCAYYYDQGEITVDQVLSTIGNAIITGIGCLYTALSHATVDEWGLFLWYVGLGVAALALQFFMDTLSAGAATIIRVAYATTLILIFLSDFIIDMLDDNYVIG